MKQLNKTLTIFISLLFLITGLTSCGNLLTADLKPQAQSSGTKQSHNAIGSINGSFTVEGAVPSQFFNTDTQTGRTAFPGLQYSSGEAEFVVEAIPDNDELEYVLGTVVDTDFSITGLELGESYTINARLEATSDGRVLLQGNASEKVTLTEDNPGAEVGTIKLLPSQEANGKGDIYLVIDASQVTNHTLTTLKVSFEKKAGETFTDPDPCSFTESGDGSIAIDIENVPSGARKMYIEVYATTANYEQDVLVYKCTETINVFDNLVTDYWVKNGNEAYLNGDNSYADFQLTNSIIERFQKTSFYVDTSTGVNAGSGSYFSPFNSVQTALTEMVYYEPELEKTLYIRGNGEGEQITNEFNTTADLNLSIEVYKAETTDPGTFRIETGGDYAFYVNEGSTLNVKGLTFDGTGFVNGGDGGFFYVNGGTANFTDCTFSNGSSCADGDAIYNKGTCTINNCTFTNNGATEIRNAVYNTGSLILSGANTFNENQTLAVGPLLNNGTIVKYGQITLEEDFISTGIPVIPVSVSNPGNYVEAGKNIFLKYVSSNLSAFNLIDCDGFALDTNGKLKYLITLSAEGNISHPATLDDAFSLIQEDDSGTIRLLAGTTVEVGYSQLSQKTISIEVEGTGNATIKLNNQLDLGNNVNFNATGIIFDGEKINPETAYNSGGLFFIGCNDGSSRANVSFKQCTFKNGKSQDNGGALYVQDNLTLENCTFENNTMNTDTPNDIVVWCGFLTLKGKNTFSSPICCNQLNGNSPSITVSGIDLTSGSPYAEISCFDWTNLNYVEPGHQIISGLKSGQESWFPCVDEGGYAIDSDGKILKSFSSIPNISDIATGSTVILTPDSVVSASDISTFLSSGGDFKVNLDLSNLSAADIKNIDPTLEHVDTLTLPGGNYVSNLYGQDQSAGGGKALGLRKVIIKGDISNKWLFQNCTGIEEVVFEEGCTTIPAGMFAGCENLETVTLPSTLKTIEWQVFRGTAIEEITIPASVTTIQNNVFFVSDQPTFKLTKVIFEDTEHHWSVRYKGTGDAYTDTYGNVYSSISVNDSSDIAAFFAYEAATQGDYWLVKNE